MIARVSVGDAVELVDFVVQFAVEMSNSILFRRFVPGYPLQALRNTQLGVVVDQPRALKAGRGFIAPVPGCLGVMNLAGDLTDTLMLVRRRLWNRQAFDHTHLPGTE